MNSLAILERDLKAPVIVGRLQEALGKTMPVERLIRTVVISAERLPQLLDCDRQSLFNAAMSAAVLGLEVDGVTGQANIIPFKGRAQLIIGYKGYNTLAARNDTTITGAVVREGDDFDFDEGEGWVRHKKQLNNKGRIIAAWAKASHLRRPAVVVVLGIDEILAVKAKSPGAKRSDSPWNDPQIGFPAMAEKTAKRRLARSMPLGYIQYASRMEEAVEEQGKAAWITPDRGTVIEGDLKTVGEIEPIETPTAQDLIGRRGPEPAMSRGPGDKPADGAVADVPGEVKPAGEPVTVPARLAEDDVDLGEAAKGGIEALRTAYLALPEEIRKHPILKAAVERRHKPTAQAVDADKAHEPAA